jgi:hypothetical protein
LPLGTSSQIQIAFNIKGLEDPLTGRPSGFAPGGLKPYKNPYAEAWLEIAISDAYKIDFQGRPKGVVLGVRLAGKNCRLSKRDF